MTSLSLCGEMCKLCAVNPCQHVCSAVALQISAIVLTSHRGDVSLQARLHLVTCHCTDISSRCRKIAVNSRCEVSWQCSSVKQLCQAPKLTESGGHVDTIRRVMNIHRVLTSTDWKNGMMRVGGGIVQQFHTLRVATIYGHMLVLSCCSVMTGVTSIYKMVILTQP